MPSSDIIGWEIPMISGAPRDDGAGLTVDVQGFEGPLDLLLALARTHKLDLAHISMLALVDQYLAYIGDAQRLKLEIAADYLVMAAWLAFLKSRLLLPKTEAEAETRSAGEMAQKLAFRLARLNAMRERAAALMTRPRLGITVFARGAPEGVAVVRETQYTADIVDLLQAYASQRTRTIRPAHVVRARRTWSIKDARLRLEKLVGESAGWTQLELFLAEVLAAGTDHRSALAASFGASLEMAREGRVEIRQEQAFAPLFMRRTALPATTEME